MKISINKKILKENFRDEEIINEYFLDKEERSREIQTPNSVVSNKIWKTDCICLRQKQIQDLEFVAVVLNLSIMTEHKECCLTQCLHHSLLLLLHYCLSVKLLC